VVYRKYCAGCCAGVASARRGRTGMSFALYSARSRASRQTGCHAQRRRVRRAATHRIKARCMIVVN
jgi:hypothetical protein